MWIFSTLGAFSIVTDSTRPGWMLIRARAQADINNLFTRHKTDCPSMTVPTSDLTRDYRYL
jgi:hypothetical protein